MLQTGQRGEFSVALPLAAFNPEFYPKTLLASNPTEFSTGAEALGDIVAVFLQYIKKQ